VGIKSILRHTLMMNLVDTEAQAKETMHPALRKWHDILLSFKTLEQLDDGANHESRLAVPDDLIHIARVIYIQRRDDLRSSLADDKMSYWEARKAEADVRTEKEKPTKRTPRKSGGS
jgi:hypothetical protein